MLRLPRASQGSRLRLHPLRAVNAQIRRVVLSHETGRAGQEMSAITQRLFLRSCISGLLIASYFSLSDLARAERVTIVALGASNTVGRGGTSYPAELEVLL